MPNATHVWCHVSYEAGCWPDVSCARDLVPEGAFLSREKAQQDAEANVREFWGEDEEPTFAWRDVPGNEGGFWSVCHVGETELLVFALPLS